MGGDFKHGIFGCFSNCSVCICTLFCPCYIAGKVAEKVGESCCLCCLVSFVPVLGCLCRGNIRGKVRDQSGIEGNCCGDMLCVWCCTMCALCQEADEVSALSMAQEMSRE